MSIGASAKGVVLGIVGLSALDLLIASKNGPAVFGTVVSTPAAWLDAWFDPSKPLIKDLRTGTATSGATPAPTTPDCSKLYGIGKTICQMQSSAAAPPTTLPNPTTPPTTTSVQALSI